MSWPRRSSSTAHCSIWWRGIPRPRRHGRRVARNDPSRATTPATPQAWATRTGAAEWLGAWDPGLAAERQEPVRVWRSPFAWLRGWMDGVVPLVADRVE